MLEKKHNIYSKQFMQKILLFIDNILLNSTCASIEESNKSLTSGILNIRDAIFTDIVKDNQIDDFNQFLNQQKNFKKKQQPENENQKDINQEIELVSDQQV